MPIGLSDENKINNDSLSILFNSEEPTDTIGVQSYNVYTENDAYSVFYKNRITNIYDQNTRFVRGFFNLNYSDIQNLNPNDIIKINEQHFVLNKVEGFNLTNKELTSVELIQFNVNPQTYPERYFKYTYCDHPEYCFQFKTDFTNPNLQDTNYVWSIYYDNQVGSLVNSTTGFTSTFRVLFNIPGVGLNTYYFPYTMVEITKEEYDLNDCYDWDCDTLKEWIYTNLDPDALLFSMATFWEAGDEVSGFTGVNVWENCTDFDITADTYGIITYDSQLLGPPNCPTPTPTPTPIPITPTPTGLNLNSRTVNLTLTKTPYYDTLTPDTSYVLLAGNRFSEIDKLYQYTFTGNTTINVIAVFGSTLGFRNATIRIYQKYYTQDEENGDRGIVRDLIYQTSAVTFLPPYGFVVPAINIAIPDFTPPTPPQIRSFVFHFEFDVEVTFGDSAPTYLLLDENSDGITDEAGNNINIEN
jgi:hypothetical protein